MTRVATFTLSAIAALGIAFAPAPAAADSEDVAKIIAGLAIAGIIAKSINDRKDRRAATQTRGPFQSIDRYDDNDTVRGQLRRRGERTNNRRWSFKNYPLPDRCRRVLNTGRGDRTVYAQNCLKRNYEFTSRLPERCEIRVRTNRGVRTVLGRRCLARDGWQVARR